jgi:uncharacterized membrane protein YczE
MVLFYRILFFLVGQFILSLGISLTIESGLGSGAWDALNVGLSETVGLTTGTWVVLVGVILIMTNALMVKRRPDIGAIITLFITGVFIDFWLLQVFDQLSVTDLIHQLLVFSGGLLTISIGLAIYIQAKFSLSPIDSLMMAIRERFGLNLMAAKTAGEVIALILALMFNGPIGIGTIIVTFAIGPLIQVFFPHFESLLNKLKANAR